MQIVHWDVLGKGSWDQYSSASNKASCTWGYTEVRTNLIVYLQDIQLYLSNTMILMHHFLNALANFPPSSGYFPLKSQLDFFVTTTFWLWQVWRSFRVLYLSLRQLGETHLAKLGKLEMAGIFFANFLWPFSIYNIYRTSTLSPGFNLRHQPGCLSYNQSLTLSHGWATESGLAGCHRVQDGKIPKTSNWNICKLQGGCQFLPLKCIVLLDNPY